MTRRATTTAVIVLLSISIGAEERPAPRRPQQRVEMEIEMVLDRAVRAFGAVKPIYERDLAVLDHLQSADEALTDTMQPNSAVQKAWQEVNAAKALEPEFLVRQGVLMMANELDAARRSPASADFGRLRVLLEREAIGPARRLVARNAVAIQNETVAWLKAQERIATHLREMSSLAAESLRKTELEE